VPEKSGFACANVRVATDSATMAIIPILARFMPLLL
jgi:hypothetical protein